MAEGAARVRSARVRRVARRRRDAAGGDAELAQYIASGNKLFHTTCVACHGKGGAGIKGNGATLVSNSFVQSLDDDALLLAARHDDACDARLVLVEVGEKIELTLTFEQAGEKTVTAQVREG